jgi:hypothetical protein
MNNNLSELKSFLKSNGITLSNEVLIAKAMRFYKSGQPKPSVEDEEENQIEDKGPSANDLAEAAVEFALNDSEDFLSFLNKRSK